MPTYKSVKKEAIFLVDEFATKHDVVKNYLSPQYKPKYSASTKLPSIGINVWVRRAMPKRVSSHMGSKFGKDWKGIGASKLEPVETIGQFIELLCQQTGTPVDPPPEPT